MLNPRTGVPRWSLNVDRLLRGGLFVVATDITNNAYQSGAGRRVHKLLAWICKQTDFVCTITFLGPEVLLGTNSQAILKYMNE